MNTALNLTLKRCISALCASTAVACLPVSAVHAEWHYGIGTGLTALDVDGTVGFDTPAGPAKLNFELTPSDVKDLSKSAFGFGGYATDRTWMIQYSLFNLELEDKASTTVGANTVTAKANFVNKGAEVTAGYPVFKSDALIVLLDGGLRYTRHDYDNKVGVTGAINTQRSWKLSNDWTDVLVGATFNVPFTPEWMWSTRFNAGFGGSDGTYLAQTGVNWRFHQHWSAGLFIKYMAVDFENGDKGDNDWYLYDADETSGGLSVLFHW